MRKSSSLIRLASALLVITAHYSLTAKAAAPVELQTYDVGSLAGQLSVEQGVASYSLPISVPPGVAGVSPELAFSYSSLNGGGVMGPGWTLDGLSTIARCGRTLEQDGSKVSIEWQQGDRYCLDGQRLILVAGTYGADGSEYRTETDSIARIRAHGQAGQGPAWFSVQTKAGQTLEYGNTADSRIEAHGRAEALAWAQNRITDAVGNFMDYVYQEETAHTEYRIASIAYTGNGAIAPTNEVRFSYTNLPSGEIKPQYIVGVTTKLTKQLSTVETYAEGVKVSDYNLSYLVRQDKPDLLEKVQLCEGSGLCQSPVTFAWQQAPSASAFASFTSWSSSGIPAVHVPNSDGGYAAGEIRLKDVNGDGLQDLIANSKLSSVGDGPSQVKVFLSNGTSFQYWSSFSASQYFGQNSIALGDVNGDGKADAVKVLSTGSAQVALQGSNGFGGYVTWLKSGIPAVHVPNSDGGYAAGEIRLKDVNGDGLQDLIANSKLSSVGDGPSQVKVFLSNGTSFQYWSSFSASQYFGQNSIALGDVNGDGKADAVKVLSTGSAQVALQGSNGFGGYVTWLKSGIPAVHVPNSDGGYAAGEIRLKDVNGDGLQDLIANSKLSSVGDGPSQVKVFLSNGTSFQYWSSFSASQYFGQNSIALGDVSGDGVSALKSTSFQSCA